MSARPQPMVGHAGRKSSERPFPTVERLHQVLRVDADGRLFWNYRFPGVAFGKEAGRPQKPGWYLTLMIDRKMCLAHRVVFAMVHGRWPVGMIDHINGDKGDNRPCNLREASSAQNNQNRGLICTNKSGAKGVCWKNNGYEVTIGAGGRCYYLGRYQDIDEAAKVYAAAAKRLHGEFANVPGVTRAAEAARAFKAQARAA